MTNRWLQLAEAHVEKGVLALAGLFMLYMLWAFMLNSPNKASYGGKEYGPGELMEAVKRDADQLESALRGAQPTEAEEIEYSAKLEQQFEQGIFGEVSTGPIAVRESLPRVASFGQPIVVPGLAETLGAETSGELVLATPLRPTQPKLCTGRSLAIEQQVVIEIDPSVEPAAAAQAPSKEVTWVTVASYFDKKAQYDEMIKAGYANYRANAYVVGQQVQRQEILSNGEYSDWQEVQPRKAMPKFDVPEPQFDDQTQELINKDEIRQAFAAVKERQTDLMQPPFYPVEAGDFWNVPPLAGYEDDAEDDDEAEVEEDKDTGRDSATSSGGRNRGQGRRPRPGGATRNPGGTSRGPSSPGGKSGSSSQNTDREERKQIRKDLREIRVLLGKKQYEDAASLAEKVRDNKAASSGVQRQAKELLKIARHWLDIQDIRKGGAGSREESDAAELITHPDTSEPAIWFHDDTVEPGKTYRYRMRVKLWNRYVGRLRALKNSEQATSSIVYGEWSYPSDPITVTPQAYFFLSSGTPPTSAGFDVWTWRKGRWIKERFHAQPGDEIGGMRRIKTGEYDSDGAEIEAEIDFRTGAVVLDIRFDEPIKARWPQKDGLFEYRDQDTVVMTYLDPADGQVKERLLSYDRKDPKNKELKEQAW